MESRILKSRNQTEEPNIIEKLYEGIKREIYFGSLKPGERLVEAEIAKRFNVSRSSVRIALQRLVGDSLITITPNKGTRVKKFSIEEIEECYKVQGLLEGYASAEALKYITADEIMSLKELQAKLRNKKMIENVDNYMRLNVLFHKVLVTKCNISMLINLIKRQRDLIFRYSYILLSIPGRIESNLNHHDLIIKAVEKKDPKKIRSLVEMHYWQSGKNLREYFEKFPFFHDM
jgi:DNA-binding GntR family transcriptional regulator